MLLVHSPSQELTFLKGGYGVDRKIVAYNFFIIIGPASDPADINGIDNVTNALAKIYNCAHIPAAIQCFGSQETMLREQTQKKFLLDCRRIQLYSTNQLNR